MEAPTPDESPRGCSGCNPTAINPILEKHGVTVSEVPVPRHKWGDVNICNDCGRAWLMHPKEAVGGERAPP